MPASPVTSSSRPLQQMDIPTRTPSAAGSPALGTPKFASLLDHAKAGERSPQSADLLPSHGAKVSDQAKIEASCRQFEGIMVKQILTASKLPLVGGTGGGGAVGAIYNDLVVQTLADQITEGGGIGLASALQTQLSHQTTGRTRGSTPASSD